MRVQVSAHAADKHTHDDGNVTELKGVQRQLAVDFLVYRTVVSEELKQKNPKGKATAAVLEEMHGNLEQYWEEVFNPTIRAGYLSTGTKLDNEVAEAAVGKYSGVLADQVNSVSDKAFLEGYNAALNKGWEKAVAWQRIADAYGLDPAQMRQWVSYYPTEGYHPDEIPKKSKDQKDKMLKARASRIGDNEGTNLQNLGKQIEWQQQHIKGDIPDLAKKVWRTAKDELVCPVCAPMDAIAIPVKAKFKTSNGEYFVPPVHVNCRCSVYILRAEDDIVKRMGNDRFNRDLNGRFSRTEKRTGRSMERQSSAFVPRASAFGVQHEAVVPPKEKKSQEQLEKEKLYSLPLAGESLPLAMQEQMKAPEPKKAIANDDAKRSEEDKAKYKRNAQTMYGLVLESDLATAEDGHALADAPVLEGFSDDEDSVFRDMISNNERGYGARYSLVAINPGAGLFDKDGNLSTEHNTAIAMPKIILKKHDVIQAQMLMADNQPVRRSGYMEVHYGLPDSVGKVQEDWGHLINRGDDEPSTSFDEGTISSKDQYRVKGYVDRSTKKKR